MIHPSFNTLPEVVSASCRVIYISANIMTSFYDLSLSLRSKINLFEVEICSLLFFSYIKSIIGRILCLFKFGEGLMIITGIEFYYFASLHYD